MSEHTRPEPEIIEVATEQVDATIALSEIARRLREQAPGAPGATAVRGFAASSDPELTRRLDSARQLAERLAEELEAIEALRPPSG